MICDTLPLFWALSSVAPALRDALSLGNLYKSGLCHQRLGVSACVAFSLVLGLSACSAESKQGHSPDTPSPENSDLNDPFATYSFENSGSDSVDDSADLLQEDNNRIETHNVGDVIKSPSTDITVKKIESRKSIQVDYGPILTEKPGKILWLLEIKWKNNLNEAADSACFGPHDVYLRVYDINGVEMLEDDDSVHISGNDCSTGLMKGETGTWRTAFHGKKEDFGWVVFDDFNGEASYVTLDPDLELKQVTDE